VTWVRSIRFARIRKHGPEIQQKKKVFEQRQLFFLLPQLPPAGVALKNMSESPSGRGTELGLHSEVLCVFNLFVSVSVANGLSRPSTKSNPKGGSLSTL
jgi:hypothetical protein